MHKLILSIVSVALLQIGFITFITTDETSDNGRFAGARTPAVDPPADGHLSTRRESIEVVHEKRDPFLRVDDGVDEAPTARSVGSERSLGRRNMRAARRVRRAKPFRSDRVIVTYAGHRPYKFADREPYRDMSIDNVSEVNRSEVSEQPVSRSQKSDEKPLINIIKKPYGWLKALGSKLK